jgi:hypothetical protein
MRIIAKRRGFGLLALAEINFFFLIKLHLDASEGHAVNQFMPAVAKRLFFAEAAAAPGINFSGLHFHYGWFALRYFRFIHLHKRNYVRNYGIDNSELKPGIVN